MVIMMCSLNLFMTLSQVLDPGDSNKEFGYYICSVPDGGKLQFLSKGQYYYVRSFAVLGQESEVLNINVHR